MLRSVKALRGTATICALASLSGCTSRTAATVECSADAGNGPRLTMMLDSAAAREPVDVEIVPVELAGLGPPTQTSVTLKGRRVEADCRSTASIRLRVGPGGLVGTQLRIGARGDNRRAVLTNADGVPLAQLTLPRVGDSSVRMTWSPSPR